MAMTTPRRGLEEARAILADLREAEREMSEHVAAWRTLATGEYDAWNTRYDALKQRMDRARLRFVEHVARMLECGDLVARAEREP